MEYKNKRGATAIEVLVVIVTLGVLFLLTFPWLEYFVDRAYSHEARVQIMDIYSASQEYLIEHERIPSKVETLAEKGFLDLDVNVGNRWDFVFVQQDGLAIKIQGTSTTYFPQGAGKVVGLNLQTGEFWGYGSQLSGGLNETE